MNAEAGEPFEAVYGHGTTGILATVEVALVDNDGNTVLGPTNVGISENIVGGTPTGVYVWNATAPTDLGQYSLIWSPDGTFNPITNAVDELVVVPFGTSTLPSIPIGEDGARATGPCSAWTTTVDVVDCCSGVEFGSDLSDVVEAIVVSSELLYESSGRQFAGICTTTARPCDDTCSCGMQVLSRGHLVGWDGSCWTTPCGCSSISEVKLSGFVREIQEVMIDGVVLDASAYRLDKNRYLVRTDGSRWPSCQSMDAANDAEGAFAVTYAYGKVPPVSGQQAARQLACEVVKACTPGVECAIPDGVIRVTRQGLTFERGFFARNEQGVWQTGMGLVDFFLNAYNPKGIQRRATFIHPASHRRYSRRVA